METKNSHTDFLESWPRIRVCKDHLPGDNCETKQYEAEDDEETELHSTPPRQKPIRRAYYLSLGRKRSAAKSQCAARRPRSGGRFLPANFNNCNAKASGSCSVFAGIRLVQLHYYLVNSPGGRVGNLSAEEFARCTYTAPRRKPPAWYLRSKYNFPFAVGMTQDLATYIHEKMQLLDLESQILFTVDLLENRIPIL